MSWYRARKSALISARWLRPGCFRATLSLIAVPLHKGFLVDLKPILLSGLLPGGVSRKLSPHRPDCSDDECIKRRDLSATAGLLQGPAVVCGRDPASAIFGGIGGGVSRDVLLNKVPGALSNPWYLILCVLAGIVAMFISYKGGQKFRKSSISSSTASRCPGTQPWACRRH